MSNQTNSTLKMIQEVVFELQRNCFVAMANVKKAIPGTKEYWQAVAKYRENESALENYKSYWGQPENIKGVN